MKKIVALVLVLSSVVFVFANELVKIDAVDDFGDPTGESYITYSEDMSGTYTNSDGKGNLLWNFQINTSSGKIIFILKENGKDTDVSTSSSSSWYISSDTEYEIIFKQTDGTTTSKVGVLTRSESYCMNNIAACVKSLYFGDYMDWNCLNLFLSNSSLKVVIKSDYGAYALGTIELDEFEGLVYDKEPYNKGVQLMNQGKYQDALDIFLLYEKDELNAYKYYNTYARVIDCHKKLGIYIVGIIGPADGYIFYDCDADNDSGNTDGLISSECGWRYLEAAPSDLGDDYMFGYYRTSDDGPVLEVGTSEKIGAGKANTEALVKAIGDVAYSSISGTHTAVYAAKGCTDYSITVDGVVYDDWFLPSKDELNLMYENLTYKGVGGFIWNTYWSSSESDSNDAWSQSFLTSEQGSDSRKYNYCVRPIRAF